MNEQKREREKEIESGGNKRVMTEIHLVIVFELRGIYSSVFLEHAKAIIINGDVSCSNPLKTIFFGCRRC